jgi:hypothetical protein
MEFYLSDRSNSGIDIIDTLTSSSSGAIGGFVGIQLTASGAVNNLRAGRCGIAWQMAVAGDGNSTLKVIDLLRPQNEEEAKRGTKHRLVGRGKPVQRGACGGGKRVGRYSRS